MLSPRALVAVLSLGFAACGDSALAPPSGLPATLTLSILRDTPTDAPLPTIVGSADSVVVEYVSGFSGCDDYDVAGGVRAGTLVVTVTATEARGRVCLAVLQYATYHVVVHRAPAGRYPVVVEAQYVEADGKRGKPREVARQVVTLP